MVTGARANQGGEYAMPANNERKRRSQVLVAIIRFAEEKRFAKN
jgi:hypothetical protein